MWNASGEIEVFVACAPGLEEMLCEELVGLGVSGCEGVPGGAELACSRPELYRVALGSALGLRLFGRVARFTARHFSELERGCRAVPWCDLLPEGGSLRLKVRSRRSRLYHTGGIAQRVESAVAAARGEAAVSEEPFELLVRLEHDQCTLSLDLAGDALHRRGYRQATSKAPVREDLARALLVAAGYEPGMAVVDPLCGAGTIAIEAALVAEGIPAGAGREFALARMPGYDAELFRAVREDLRRAPVEPAAPIFGSDRDAGAIRAARLNALRAGVGDRVGFREAAISGAPMPQAERGLLVTNPPYGHRMGSPKKLRDLYASIGRVRQGLGHGWRLALLARDPALVRATGVRMDSAFLTDLGGLKVRAFVEA